MPLEGHEIKVIENLGFMVTLPWEKEPNIWHLYDQRRGYLC